MNIIAVVTTIDDADKARSIAATLVERKRAARVQISKIESVYEWQGNIENDVEYRVRVKTRRDLYHKVESAIIELHSYDLPAVHAFDIAGIYGPYADWVESSCHQ